MLVFQDIENRSPICSLPCKNKKKYKYRQLCFNLKRGGSLSLSQIQIQIRVLIWDKKSTLFSAISVNWKSEPVRLPSWKWTTCKYNLWNCIFSVRNYNFWIKSNSSIGIRTTVKPPANISSWLLSKWNVSRRELNNSISGNIISEIAFLVLKVISLPEMPKFLFLKTKSKSSTLVHTTVKKLQISFWMIIVLIEWWNLNHINHINRPQTQRTLVCLIDETWMMCKLKLNTKY